VSAFRLVDTDVFSFLFKGTDTRASAYQKEIGPATLCLSFMSVAELRSWALERRWGEWRRRNLDSAIQRCLVLWPDERTIASGHESMHTADG
jgi:predicted nucleic acid-binding protein